MSTDLLRVARRRPLQARVGLLGVGHHTYWAQFDGLLDEMHRKLNHFKARLEKENLEVVEFGMLDNAETAYAAVEKIKAANVDLLFVDMVTYATSSTFGVLCREINVPMVLVALQPLERWTTPAERRTCSFATMTTVRSRSSQASPFASAAASLRASSAHMENDPEADAQVKSWCSIAKVLHDLRKSRIGLMGHVLEAMLDMHTDPTAITAAFGPHVVLVEPDDILHQYRATRRQARRAKEEGDP